MIAYYIDKGPITYRDNVYQTNVPTWIPWIQHGDLLDNKFFKKYDPDKTDYAECKILVHMPSDLIHYINAIGAVKRIQENFPTAQIHIIDNPNYTSLMPNYVRLSGQNINYLRERAYYRSYNLTSSSNPDMNNNIILRSMPLAQILLRATRMENNSDRDKLPVFLDLPKVETNRSKPMVCIIDIKSELHPLTEKLVDKMNGFYDIIGIDKYHVEDLNDYINTFANSDLIIGIGHTPLSYLAAAFSKKVPLFMAVEESSIIISNQYHIYYENKGRVACDTIKSGVDIPEVLYNKIKLKLNVGSKDDERNIDTGKRDKNKSKRSDNPTGGRGRFRQPKN